MRSAVRTAPTFFQNSVEAATKGKVEGEIDTPPMPIIPLPRLAHCATRKTIGLHDRRTEKQPIPLGYPAHVNELVNDDTQERPTPRTRLHKRGVISLQELWNKTAPSRVKIATTIKPPLSSAPYCPLYQQQQPFPIIEMQTVPFTEEMTQDVTKRIPWKNI